MTLVIVNLPDASTAPAAFCGGCRQRPPTRIYQFDRSRGVVGFPDKPQDALKTFDRATLRSLE